MQKNMSGSLSGVIDEMLSGSVAGNISFESSGGSNVTITPTLESGTKIADFTIDETSGELYAPTPESPIEYTAGDNIQISENNVISATDTTYTAGSGITIENNVISAVGGGGVEVVPLFTASEYYQSIVLDESLFDYDFIMISAYATAGTGYLNTSIHKTSDISIGNNFGVSDDGAFIWYNILDATHLIENGRSGSYFIKAIYGINI